MIVSNGETNISTNIRAIIEQLNLNPVTGRRRRRYTHNDTNCPSTCQKTVNTTANITFGVYGCNRGLMVDDSSIKIKKNLLMDNIDNDEKNKNKKYNDSQDNNLLPSCGKIVIAVWNNGKQEDKRVQVFRSRKAEMRQRMPEEQKERNEVTQDWNV